MARALYLLIWILSALAIAFLAFMPDYMGRNLYSLFFTRGFYLAHNSVLQFLAHAAFFLFNSYMLLLLLNTCRQISETQKFMVTFVWVALLSIFSEVGQSWFIPAEYNRSGFNLKDAAANFSGFFVAWILYFVCVKLFLNKRRRNGCNDYPA